MLDKICFSSAVIVLALLDHKVADKQDNKNHGSNYKGTYPYVRNHRLAMKENVVEQLNVFGGAVALGRRWAPSAREF